jgi:hypothetical protein
MSGFTKEEIFLNKLGENSFLRFWSWPNLFRDQGGNKGDGKEICDLTIIFGDDILLFSDKKIDYNKDKDTSVAWARWARKAIGDSVKQIKGARRWIAEYPSRVFIDAKCTQKIPINLPSKESVRFHNIVVCHGIEDILASFNNESSFIFDNSIRGDQHWDKDDCTPFHLGQIIEGGVVHVFNESTIELVLQEFDTAKDFIQYLKQRGELLSSEKYIKAYSESDIIQLYYENYKVDTGERSIWPDEAKNADSLIIDKGGIHNLYTNPSFIARKNEDTRSYFWDHLIESFSFHIMNGSAEYQNWDLPSEIEPSIRYMAATGRFERRILADAFLEFYDKALPGQRGTRLCFDPTNKTSAYLFLALPNHESIPSPECYREIRRGMLQDYCIINKLLDQRIDYILGIAFKTREPGINIDESFFSEGQDFVFINFKDWDATDVYKAQKLHDEYVGHGLLVQRELFMENISEFPIANSGFRRSIDFKGRDRNLPCICGSGIKIKKCCGRP